MTNRSRRRRLPIKTLYRGLELSVESEILLEEAMVKVDASDPREALKTALRLFLEHASEEKTTS